MTAVIIAPRVEDALSNVERFVSAGFFQLRPSKTYVAGGQWVQSSWSDPVYFDGTEKTALLDALPDNPYELYAEYPDNRGGTFVIREFRTVLDSAQPVKWETLQLSGGPGSTVPVPTNFEARLLAVEQALGNVSGGATTLAGITDMTAYTRDLNKATSDSQARTKLGAGTSSVVVGSGAGQAADGAATAAGLGGLGGRLTTAEGDIDSLETAVAARVQAAGDLSGAASTPTVAKVRGVAVSSTAPTAGQILVADSATSASWQGSASGISVAGLPPGSAVVVRKDPTSGFWPASWNTDGTPNYSGGSASAGVRPTARGDIYVEWRGKAPHPPIVSSGTGGVRDNVDTRVVLP